MKKNYKFLKKTGVVMLTAAICISGMTAPVTTTKAATKDTSTVSSTTKSTETAKSTTKIPSKYDGRSIDVGERKQYSGNCGYFAVLENAEIKYKQLTGKEIKLSPTCLAYAETDGRNCPDPLGNYEDKWLEAKADTDDLLHYAANLAQNTNHTAFTLASWRGVRERDDVLDEEKIYNNRGVVTEIDSSYTTQADQMLHLSNFYNFFGMQDDTDGIKEMIMKCGSVQCTYRAVGWGSTAKDGIDCFYTNSSKYSTHSVAIIGWDDNFDKNQFSSQNGGLPEHNGAWLTKQWGSADNNDCYEWISYETKPFYIDGAYEFESADNYDYNYQYDPVSMAGAGFMSPLNGNVPDDVAKDGMMQANIFTAKSNIDLKAAGFWTDTTYTNNKIEIYTGCKENPTDGTLVETVDGIDIKYRGYHTEKLNKSIVIPEGEKFSVVITSKATEKSRDEYAGFTINSGYATESNVSFYKGASENEWRPLSTGDGNSISVKAFADEHKGFTVSYENPEWFTTVDGYNAGCVEANADFAFKATSKLNSSKYAVRVDGKTVLPDSDGVYHITKVMSNKTVTTTTKDKYVVHVNVNNGNKYIVHGEKSYSKVMDFETDYSFSVGLDSNIYEYTDDAKKDKTIFDYITVESDSEQVTIKKDTGDLYYRISVNGVGASGDIDINVSINKNMDPKDLFKIRDDNYNSHQSSTNSSCKYSDYTLTNEDFVILFPKGRYSKFESTSDHVTNNADGSITIDTSALEDEKTTTIKYTGSDENGVSGETDALSYTVETKRTAPDISFQTKLSDQEISPSNDFKYTAVNTDKAALEICYNVKNNFTDTNKKYSYKTYVYFDHAKKGSSAFLTDEELANKEFEINGYSQDGTDSSKTFSGEKLYDSINGEFKNGEICVIYAYVEDNLGNRSKTVHSGPILLDSYSPTMKNVSTITQKDQKASFSYQAEDGESDVTYTITRVRSTLKDGQFSDSEEVIAKNTTKESITDEEPFNGENESTYYKIIATDEAGNCSNEKETDTIFPDESTLNFDLSKCKAYVDDDGYLRVDYHADCYSASELHYNVDYRLDNDEEWVGGNTYTGEESFSIFPEKAGKTIQFRVTAYSGYGSSRIEKTWVSDKLDIPQLSFDTSKCDAGMNSDGYLEVKYYAKSHPAVYTDYKIYYRCDDDAEWIYYAPEYSDSAEISKTKFALSVFVGKKTAQFRVTAKDAYKNTAEWISSDFNIPDLYFDPSLCKVSESNNGAAYKLYYHAFGCSDKDGIRYNIERILTAKDGSETKEEIYTDIEDSEITDEGDDIRQSKYETIQYIITAADNNGRTTVWSSDVMTLNPDRNLLKFDASKCNVTADKTGVCFTINFAYKNIENTFVTKCTVERILTDKDGEEYRDFVTNWITDDPDGSVFMDDDYQTLFDKKYKTVQYIVTVVNNRDYVGSWSSDIITLDPDRSTITLDTDNAYAKRSDTYDALFYICLPASDCRNKYVNHKYEYRYNDSNDWVEIPSDSKDLKWIDENNVTTWLDWREIKEKSTVQFRVTAYDPYDETNFKVWISDKIDIAQKTEPTAEPTQEPTSNPNTGDQPKESAAPAATSTPEAPIVSLPSVPSRTKTAVSLRSGEKFTVKNVTYAVRSTGKNKTVKVVSVKKSLKTVNIPDAVKYKKTVFKVTEIGQNAFKGCKAQKVTIGKNVVLIRKNAFKNCRSLKEIRIKGSKIRVEKNAFKTGNSRTTIRVSKKNLKKLTKVIRKSSKTVKIKKI